MKEILRGEYSDEEQLQKAKKIKAHILFDAVIFGILIGIAIYSSVKNGFGLLTFLPLVYLPIATKNKAKNKGLTKILKERNLKYEEEFLFFRSAHKTVLD